MANKKINQLDVRTSPNLTDLLAIADPSSGYAYKITGTSLQSLLDVTNRVPYTGASSNVNLGEFGLAAGQLTLDTSPTGTAVVGTTQWNDTIGSSQTLLKGGNVLLKNGVDLVARVVNKVSPATTLTKAAYQAVRVSGAQGQRLAVAYAQANNYNNSADTIGLVCETIAANQEGFIITVGQLLEVNTTGSLQGETWADGDVLYLSPTTAGNITNVKPNGSNGHIVVIGYVEYAHAVHGSIYVKTMNGWELDELHNVYINTPANNEVLTYESSTSLWKNKSISTILGYTPQAAITLTTTGSSGAATFVSNTLNIPTVTLAGLGGASDSLVMHLAGTETATGVKTFSIGLATTTGDNFMNTSSGNLLVGYSSTPASNLYKLNVNGNTKFNNLYVNDGTQYSLTFNAGTTNGQLLLSGSYPSVVLKTSTGDNRVVISNDGPNAKIQMWYGTLSSIYFDTNADGYYSLGLAVGKTSAPVTTAILELSSVSRGLLLPRMTTAQKNAISTPATSLLLYDTDLATFQYYSGSAWTSLGGGGGISGSGTAGQVTYWSGTSAVTGSSNLFWDNTNARLGIGTSSPTTQLNVNQIAGTVKGIFISGDEYYASGNGTANKGIRIVLGVNRTNNRQLWMGDNDAFGSSTLSVFRYQTGIAGFAGLDATTGDGLTRLTTLIGSDTSNVGIGYDSSSPTIANYTAKLNSFTYNASTTNLLLKKFAASSGNFLEVVNTSGTTLATITNSGSLLLNTIDAGYRLDINGTGATAGALRVTGGNVQFGSSTGLNWDNTNSRLGIGTSSPTGEIHILKSVGSGGAVGARIKNSAAAGESFMAIYDDLDEYAAFEIFSSSWPITALQKVATFTTTTANGFQILMLNNSSTANFSINTTTSKTERFRLWNSTGNITIQNGGTFTDNGYRLDVQGTFRATGRVRLSGLPTSATGLSAGDLWNNSGVINIV